MNVTEEICGEWLRHCRGCEFIQYNMKTPTRGGEIDVIAINLSQQTIYCCEVAAHLTTGLMYVTGSKTTNFETLTAKFNTDIDTITRKFPGYRHVFMLWSPIVNDGRGRTKPDQMNDVQRMAQSIKTERGIEIELVLNESFKSAMNDLRAIAGKTQSALETSFMRYLQIEEWLGRFAAKLG